MTRNLDLAWMILFDNIRIFRVFAVLGTIYSKAF